MEAITAACGLPQRSPFGHLWRSVVAGGLSGSVVGALGAMVGPIRSVLGGAVGSDLVVGILMPVGYAAVAGAVIGIVAGLATMAQRGRFDDQMRRRTARILALVVAVPAGVLLFPFWQVATASNAVFVLAMLGSVLYCGLGTYLTAKASLLFVLGGQPEIEHSTTA
jgi:hypothetical protein